MKLKKLLDYIEKFDSLFTKTNNLDSGIKKLDSKIK